MSDILAKRRAPSRPSMKSAILTSETNLGGGYIHNKSSSPNITDNATYTSMASSSKSEINYLSYETSTSAISQASHTSPISKSKSQPTKQVDSAPVGTLLPSAFSTNTRSSLMVKEYNYDKKKYSPLCITRMPAGYRTDKTSLIQELRAKIPDMYDLLYILKTRPKALSERDPNELTVLQLACSSYTSLTISHRISFCRQLMSIYPKAVIQRDSDGQTALHHALQITPSPSLRLIRSLLACDPSCAKMKDSSGSLPLHAAVMGTSSNAIIKMLVLAYPDGISVQDGTGTTALEYVRSRLKSPSQATVALLSVDGVWARPDVIMSLDVVEPDPEEVYAAAFLQAWYKKLHAPKLLTFKYPKAQQRGGIVTGKSKKPTREVALSSWEHDAATTIQALVRGACLRLRFSYGVRAVTCIQRILRGCIVRIRMHQYSSKYRAMRMAQRKRVLLHAQRKTSANPRDQSGTSPTSSAGEISTKEEKESLNQSDRNERSKVFIQEGVGAGENLADIRRTVRAENHTAVIPSMDSARPLESATTVQKLESASVSNVGTAPATSSRDMYVESLQQDTLPVMYEVAVALVVYLGVLVWINLSPAVDEALHQAALDFSTISRPASVIAHHIVKSSTLKATRMPPSFVIPGVGNLPLAQAALAMTVASFIAVCIGIYTIRGTISVHRADSKKISSLHRQSVARSLSMCAILVTITWSLYALWLDTHMHAVIPIMSSVRWDVQYVLALSLAVVPIAIYPIVACYVLLSSPTLEKRKSK